MVTGKQRREIRRRERPAVALPSVLFEIPPEPGQVLLTPGALRPPAPPIPIQKPDSVANINQDIATVQIGVAVARVVEAADTSSNTAPEMAGKRALAKARIK